MNRPLAIACVTFWLLPYAGMSQTNTNDLASLVGMLATRLAPSPTNAEQVLKTTAVRLRRQFDEWLKEPAAYRERALRECKVFPEGRIYPFAIPALAYANLGIADAKVRPHSAAQMRKLIDALISVMVEDISPPAGELKQMVHYQNQGTRLASLNLTLACYALISDDGHYSRLHDHVAKLLRQVLIEKAGAPIASYPEYTWYFDTIMALVSLEMYDRAHGGGQTRELIERHFKWLRQHATDAETKLPLAYERGLPRGCDLSMQICLLQHVDRKAAHSLYGDFAMHYWVDLGFIAGFREWPRSKGAALLGDIDSGPLVFGIAPTATGVGIGSAKAVGDTNRLSVLARQLQSLPNLVRGLEKAGQKLFGDEVPVSSQYLTGFMYGDAVLFYAVTWVPYPEGAKRPDESAGREAKP